MLMTSMIIYFIGIFSLILNRYHLMMVLMSIEYMYMSLVMSLLIIFSITNSMNIFIFFVSIVCEAALGLSLLVLFNFYYGNEMLNSFSLIKC
uniref:NADH dehydrogenase subunit 4L n=1 Tax=Amblyomma naponense TaxID=251387 RepID=UPI002E7A5E06|nr:NADH dehydrogenase subunit 4L [Amblyomma naponense]WQF69001.1 NADH dehydrogenase subunit 4L [Amblyomma naponense]